MSKSGRGWDSESVEKSRLVCNLVFQCWKQSYKMTIKSNLTPVQRHIINELKKDGLILILFCRQRKSGHGRGHISELNCGHNPKLFCWLKR